MVVIIIHIYFLHFICRHVYAVYSARWVGDDPAEKFYNFIRDSNKKKNMADGKMGAGGVNLLSLCRQAYTH